MSGGKRRVCVSYRRLVEQRRAFGVDADGQQCGQRLSLPLPQLLCLLRHGDGM